LYKYSRSFLPSRIGDICYSAHGAAMFIAILVVMVERIVVMIVILTPLTVIYVVMRKMVEMIVEVF
jgi:hypothetical protein